MNFKRKVWSVFCTIPIFLFFNLSFVFAIDSQGRPDCLENFKTKSNWLRPGVGCLGSCIASQGLDLKTFDCPWDKYCNEFCKSQPCIFLQDYAKSVFVKKNRCKILIDIVNEAIKEAEETKDPSNNLMENLKKVLIGDGKTDGRGHGPCFAGNIFGSEGFKEDLRDQFNQIQHAMAGLYIGYKYGYFACGLAILQDPQIQDKKLYQATCPLGKNLNNTNYKEIGLKLREAIGDETC